MVLTVFPSCPPQISGQFSAQHLRFNSTTKCSETGRPTSLVQQPIQARRYRHSPCRVAKTLPSSKQISAPTIRLQHKHEGATNTKRRIVFCCDH